MTIEQKAQRYNEALKRAKKLYEQGTITESLSYVFPELAESEDERIRKELIQFIKNWKDPNNIGRPHDFPTLTRNVEQCDKYIAWLEKQGESIDINPSEFDLHLNKLLKQFETLPKEELVSSLSFYLNVVQNDGTYKDEEEQDGQKPTDEEMKTLLRTEYEKGRADVIAEMQSPAWSEEDIRNIENIDSVLFYDKDLPEDTCVRLRNWLKSLKHQNMCVYNPYKAVVESIAEMCKHYDKASHSGLRDFYDNVKVKCKDAKEYDSLYPQNCWKPSDVQMKALKYVAYHLMPDNNYREEMFSLYEQLKKLKEE